MKKVTLMCSILTTYLILTWGIAWAENEDVENTTLSIISYASGEGNTETDRTLDIGAIAASDWYEDSNNSIQPFQTVQPTEATASPEIDTASMSRHHQFIPHLGPSSGNDEMLLAYHALVGSVKLDGYGNKSTRMWRNYTAASQKRNATEAATAFGANAEDLNIRGESVNEMDYDTESGENIMLNNTATIGMTQPQVIHEDASSEGDQDAAAVAHVANGTIDGSLSSGALDIMSSPEVHSYNDRGTMISVDPQYFIGKGQNYNDPYGDRVYDAAYSRFDNAHHHQHHPPFLSPMSHHYLRHQQHPFFSPKFEAAHSLQFHPPMFTDFSESPFRPSDGRPQQKKKRKRKKKRPKKKFPTPFPPQDPYLPYYAPPQHLPNEGDHRRPFLHRETPTVPYPPHMMATPAFVILDHPPHHLPPHHPASLAHPPQPAPLPPPPPLLFSRELLYSRRFPPVIQLSRCRPNSLFSFLYRKLCETQYYQYHMYR